MAETISFEMARDADGNIVVVSVNMPVHPVMSHERFRRLFEYYGQFISYDTHTPSGRPVLTFLFSDGEWRYVIDADDGQFLHCTLIRHKEAKK